MTSEHAESAHLSKPRSSSKHNSSRQKSPEFIDEQRKGTKAWKTLERSTHFQAMSHTLRCRPFNVGINKNAAIPIHFVGEPWKPHSNTIYMPSIGSGPAAFEEDDESLYQAITEQNSFDSGLLEYTCPNRVIGRLLYNNLYSAIDPSKCSKLELRNNMKRSWMQFVDFKPSAESDTPLNNAKQQLKEFLSNLIKHIEVDQTCAIAESPSKDKYPELVILARDQITPPLKALDDSSSESQQIGWETCIALIKCCEEGLFLTDPEAKRTMMLEIAKNVRDIFAYQPHRRYVHSVILTQYSYVYQRWDRAGLVQSPIASYRRKGTRGKLLDIKNAQINLLDLLQRLVACDTDLQGFEDTMRYDEGKELRLTPSRTFTSKAPGKGSFTLKERLLHSYTLASRGTTGWLAVDNTDDSTWLIIDNWIPHEEFFERPELRMKLRQLLTVPRAGLLSFEAEEVVCINRTGEQDAVYDNRTWDPDVGRDANLVHIRAFWHRQDDLQPLEMAPTAKHILFACRDVVKALQFLYINGRIVHQDIAPWNIVWCQTSEGVKGFLIDFSCAAMLQEDPEWCEPRTDMTPGAQLFMSINALRNEHTRPCNDLESLFYVLMWIFGGHQQLPITKAKVAPRFLPPVLGQWTSLAEEEVVTNKVEFFQITSRDIYEKEFFLQKDFKFLEGFMRDFYEALVDYEPGSESVTKDHERCFQRVLFAFETVCRTL